MTRPTLSSLRAGAVALALLPALACFDAPLDAITAGAAGDAGQDASGAPAVAGDGGDAASTPVAPPGQCVPGAVAEQEPNDQIDRATATSATAICGEVGGGDVDFLRLLAADAGAVTAVVVERLGGDGLDAVLLVNGVEAASGSVQANVQGSVTMSPPPGTTSDSVVRIVSPGANAQYVVRVTR